MALKWPDKNPDMTEDFSIDWSRALKTGETISSSTWNVRTGELSQAVTSATPIEKLVPEYPTGLTNTDTVATIRFSDGKVNTKYRCTNTIVTTDDRTLTQDVYLRVTEGA